MVDRSFTKLLIGSLFLITSNISFAPVNRTTPVQRVVYTSAGRNNRIARRVGQLKKPTDDVLGNLLATIFCCYRRK